MTHAEPVVTVYIPAQVSGISTSKSLTARVITSKPFDDGDVALLKVDATNTPALPLATSANIVIGEHDISIGYPVEVRKSTDASLSPSYKDGTISSQRTVNDGKFKVYETSAAIGHGMSGGPTINEAGEVLGINSFGPIESDAAFNFIRPSEMLGELLKSQGVENTVDPTQQEYLAGLDAYFAGDRSTALEHFDNVLADVPSHSFALHYRTLALALPAASTSHTFRNVLVAAFLLLIAGGGRRRPDRAAPRPRRRLRPGTGHAGIRAHRARSRRPGPGRAGSDPAGAGDRGAHGLRPRHRHERRAAPDRRRARDRPRRRRHLRRRPRGLPPPRDDPRPGRGRAGAVRPRLRERHVCQRRPRQRRAHPPRGR